MITASARWRSIVGYGALTGTSFGVTVGTIDAVMNMPAAWLAGVGACLSGGLVGAFAQWRRFARSG